MASDGSTHNPTRHCERCGYRYQTSQQLHRHLTTGACKPKRKGGSGIIIGHENGESEIAPRSPRDLWME